MPATSLVQEILALKENLGRKDKEIVEGREILAPLLGNDTVESLPLLESSADKGKLVLVP